MSTTLLGDAMAPEYRPAVNNTVTAIAKYRCVKRVAAEAPLGVEPTAADTDIPCGITDKAIAASGGDGEVVIRGRTRVVASAAITAGARITCESSGKVKAAIAADIVIGTAVDAATADNDVIMAEVDLVAPVLF